MLDNPINLKGIYSSTQREKFECKNALARSYRATLLKEWYWHVAGTDKV